MILEDYLQRLEEEREESRRQLMKSMQEMHELNKQTLRINCVVLIAMTLAGIITGCLVGLMARYSL